VIAAAAALCWPAIWNGYPLLMSDSAEYVRDGSPVLQMLLQPSLVRVVETRSELYSLVILPLHRNVTVWPVVVWQALLTAWVLWLVVRSLALRRPVAVYLVLVVGLNLLSPVGWHVSYVLPDILGSVLYLCVYLLVFAGETLRPWEVVAAAATSIWCVASHGTHLLVGGGLCIVLVAAWMLRWYVTRGRGRGVLLAVGVVLVASGLQVGLHARIYHRASLFGFRPPFLMARLIADGPARLYLQQHCSTLHWAICDFVQRLPMSDAQFLWSPGSIWSTATWQQRQGLSQQEMLLARATLHAYPLQQAKRSLANFVAQLTTFGVYNCPDFNIFPAAMEDGIMPGLAERFHATPQSRDAMHEAVFRPVYAAVVGLSAVAIMLLLPWVWRAGWQRLQGLCVVVLFAVVANAFVTGVLSGVYARYQGRVVWLVPLLAAVLLYRYGLTRRGVADGSA
jgi:hypothetical protein